MKLFIAGFLLTVLSCSGGPLDPLLDGKRYMLMTVNGQPLPQRIPYNISPIDVGWVKLVNDSTGERHEHYSDGTIIGGWTALGRATLQNGLLILAYLPGEVGPLNPVDTFYVSDKGLVLRERLGAPPDSLIRFYQRP